MAAPDLASLIAAAPSNASVTLDPPRKEFQGPLVIRKPVAIHGQGGTIWAERGPVVIIECAGVVLNDLGIEITGGEDKLSGEEGCALVVRNGHSPKLTDVGVRGNVEGLAGESGSWRYPRSLRLGRLKAHSRHIFRVRLFVPVASRIESTVSGVIVQPRDVPAGAAELSITVESLGDGVRLRGPLLLKSASLVRRIELTGHIATGDGCETGIGKIIYEPDDWSTLSTTEPPKQAPAAPQPVPTPVPAKSATVAPPSAPTAPPAPQPPPRPKSIDKQKARHRFVDTTALPSVFGAPASEPTAPVVEPAEPETTMSPLWGGSPAAETEEVPPSTPAPPVPTPPPPAAKPPQPTKKSSFRKTEGLSGLFGGDPS